MNYKTTILPLGGEYVEKEQIKQDNEKYGNVSYVDGGKRVQCLKNQHGVDQVKPIGKVL